MYKMKYADYSGVFHGFTLKEGFYYGIDTETGDYIATSGWEDGFGNVAIYFLEDKNWKMYWISIDSDFKVENLPEFSTDDKDKMPFNKWLWEELSIDSNYYDNNYSELMLKQIEGEYRAYYYDGLPQFVIHNL